jgi:hypothetical protein
LAYKLAEILKIPHRFNKQRKCAGKQFYYNFMRRHPELSLRTSESPSLQRAVGFNRPQVDRFLDKLEALQKKHSFPPAKKGTYCNKTQTSGTSRKKLQFSGQVASAESGTTACIICSEIFDEDWIKCLSCGGWAHENCAVTEGNMLYYKCDFCKRH